MYARTRHLIRTPTSVMLEIKTRPRTQILRNVPISQFKTLLNKYFATFAELRALSLSQSNKSQRCCGNGASPGCVWLVENEGTKCSHLGVKFFIPMTNHTSLDRMAAIIYRNPQPAGMQVCSKLKADTTQIKGDRRNGDKTYPRTGSTPPASF